MIVKSFLVKTLQQNLRVGSGANLALPALKSVHVHFGDDNCFRKYPISLFYVNELPRIYASNPSIVVKTTDANPDGSDAQSTISLVDANGTEHKLDLFGCTTSANIFSKFVEAIQEPAKST
ncbi:uncharacterized protein BJ171DRAFT_599208 [Polychytrium aggregatum]|uniref:uncharacterized protein n=1 Tax=Polychytrium aggregatum TaxID=110093 RepID=UPI0022FDF1C4|nr:uncharacterized protein BJ171DRAFT_599208 [Polychytrium aggregatum]KAI9204401.1 hypothetical protein BJ171DRAFT_599208 [Polychytrium aggregatum]